MLAALAVAFATSSCFAPSADYFSVQSGSGDSVDVSGVGWELPLTDACNKADRLRSGLLFRMDTWHGNRAGGRELVASSVTPFLRYELGRVLDAPFYAEAGFGANLLSKTRIDNERQFSTAFQFGEFIGLSMRYGRERNEFGVRLQHVSNGSIKKPNDGLTYGMVFFNYHF